jgi:hypothetical protein
MKNIILLIIMITIISCNGEKKNNKVVASEENNTFNLKKITLKLSMSTKTHQNTALHKTENSL